MGDRSAIEWTDATWNPIVGCSIVSPGCTNCYAMSMAARIDKMTLSSHYEGLTKQVNGKQVWTGKLARAPYYIFTAPLRWKRPRRIFVNSMGDLFHEDVPDAWIDTVFAVMVIAHEHIYQVLTKRSARMRAYFSDELKMRGRIYDAAEKLSTEKFGSRSIGLGVWPLPNVWLGVSAENQHWLVQRATDLVETPAAVRFLSCEPLLNPLDLTPFIFPVNQWAHLGGDWLNNYPFCYPKNRINWIIAGGESGPGARPMHPDWARSIRDQCAAAGVAFFFKQWGEFLPVGQNLPGYGKVHGATGVKPGRMKLHYGGTPHEEPKHVFAERGVEFTSTNDGRLTFRVGKKRAGRLLDGIEHNGYPA
jgi:protein gp37